LSFWDGSRWVGQAAKPSLGPFRGRRLRDWISTLVMLLALLAVAIPLLQSNAATLALTVSPAAALAGARVTVTGYGLPPKTTVQLLFDGSVVDKAARISANGELKSSFTVPPSSLGPHAVTAVTTSSPASSSRAALKSVAPGAVLASGTLTVTAPAEPTVAPTLGPTPAPVATPVATAVPASTPSPVPAPSSAPAATPPPAMATPSAAPVAVPPVVPAGGTFVSACGRNLCLGGATWRLYGGSVYSDLDDPAGTIALATAARLNTVRPTNLLDPMGTFQLAPTWNYEPYWRQMDALIAEAQRSGVRVILDLSLFRDWNNRLGVNAYLLDWGPYINFVTGRRNTVSGVLYREDPTIALVSIAGEPVPPNSSENTLGVTSDQLVAFYRRTLAAYRQADPNHLVATGGFSNINWSSGIDWLTIFSDPNDMVCNIHNYSDQDSRITTPNVAQLCASLGKPWITEEFGWVQGIGDDVRAANFQAMYGLQAQYGSAGIAFWNLKHLIGPGHYDVDPATPLTWAVVLRNAP